MDLPAPPLSDYAEPSPPWRKAAIVTAAIAAVELVALAVIALAFIAKPFAVDSSTRARTAKESEKAAAGQAAATKEPAPPASLPRSQTSVLVLNGNGVEGAAATTAERLLALDYPVAAVADAARRNFPRTIVMYRDGFEGEAVRLTRDLDLGPKRAVPLDGMRPDELGDAKLALVLGG